MDCSEVRALWARWLDRSITDEQRALVLDHTATCRTCAAWPQIMYWSAMASCTPEEEQADEITTDDRSAQLARPRKADPGTASPGMTNSDKGNSRNGLRDRLVDETYPPPADTFGEDYPSWWGSAEFVFLRAKREDLPAIMEELELEANQTDNEYLHKTLEDLKEHIRWADDLARKSGVPDDCVFPPAMSDEADETESS